MLHTAKHSNELGMLCLTTSHVSCMSKVHESHTMTVLLEAQCVNQFKKKHCACHLSYRRQLRQQQ